MAVITLTKTLANRPHAELTNLTREQARQRWPELFTSEKRDPLEIAFPFNAKPNLRTRELYEALVRFGRTPAQASMELAERHEMYTGSKRDMALYNVNGLPIRLIAETQGGCRYLHWLYTDRGNDWRKENGIKEWQQPYGPLGAALDYLHKQRWFMKVLQQAFTTRDDWHHLEETPLDYMETSQEPRIEVYEPVYGKKFIKFSAATPSDSPLVHKPELMPNERPEEQLRLTPRKAYRPEDEPGYATVSYSPAGAKIIGQPPRKTAKDINAAWTIALDCLDQLSRVAGAEYRPDAYERWDGCDKSAKEIESEKLEEILDTLRLQVKPHYLALSKEMQREIRTAVDAAHERLEAGGIDASDVIITETYLNNAYEPIPSGRLNKALRSRKRKPVASIWES